MTKLPFSEQLHDVVRTVYVIYNPDFGFIQATERYTDLVKALQDASLFDTREDAEEVLGRLTAGLRERAEVRRVHQMLRLGTA